MNPTHSLGSYIETESFETSWTRIDVFGYPHCEFIFAFRFDPTERCYGVFVREWRIAYRELSSLIRRARTAFRNRHRSAGGLEAWRSLWPEVTEYCKLRELEPPTLEDEALVWPLKAYARYLLALRASAKRAPKPRPAN